MMALWWRLSLLGTLGVLSLLFAPIEQLVRVPADPLMLRLASLVQPLVLVLLAAALGGWAAPRVGLDAPVARAWAEKRPLWPALRPQLPAGALGGLFVAGVVLAYWGLVRGLPTAAPLFAFEMPLVTKLLYGGLVEELLLRWGVMSLLVWGAWRVGGRSEPVPAWAYWAGLAGAAILFAAGHIPALQLLVPDPEPALVALALVGNLLPGLLLGWLFWRRGLEAAILAHGLGHLISSPLIALLS